MLTSPRSRAASAPPSKMLADLETLLKERVAIYLCLEEKGAVFSVKSPEMVAFGRSIIQGWSGLPAARRAQKVAEWIEEAARYARNPRIRWKPA